MLPTVWRQLTTWATNPPRKHPGGLSRPPPLRGSRTPWDVVEVACDELSASIERGAWLEALRLIQQLHYDRLWKDSFLDPRHHAGERSLYDVCAKERIAGYDIAKIR